MIKLICAYFVVVVVFLFEYSSQRICGKSATIRESQFPYLL